MATLALPAPSSAATTPTPPAKTLRFAFGARKAPAGVIAAPPTLLYSDATGYGFEPGTPLTAVDRGGSDHYCTSPNAAPFLFSVALPEGNYRVTITFGDPTGVSTTTVRAELRRLMLESVQTPAGKRTTRTFTVNIRTPQIAGTGGAVHLKPREQTREIRNWDDRLTLEFSGARPCVDSVEITPVRDAVTVYLLGDSTVCDQPDEPWSAWGQMLPRFFSGNVAVANHAESGESLRSSLGAKRLDKVLSVIQPGDYAFIQFGHNDQKEHGEGVGAFTTYKASLKQYVAAIRQHGGFPVLVTSMNRRRFDTDGKLIPTLGDYPEAVRQAAQEDKVPLIDLNAMSKTLFEAMGPDGTLKAFVHYPANTFPGQAAALKDDTHFNAYGAYELARCIVEGIRSARLGLAHSLAPDIPPFDPAHPDPVDVFHLPASAPPATLATPAGS